MASWLVSCLLASVSIAAPADAPHEASFDYLYIKSNEGGSSGGHTAIRFDHDVYHFQNEDGLLVLKRDDADEFLFAYALLGNRAIQSTRVGVSTQTRSRLVDRFRRRHRAQQAQIEVRDGLRADRLLLEAIRNEGIPRTDRSKPGSRAIPGLGYFDRALGVVETHPQPSEGTDEHREHSKALITLGHAIGEAYGPSFVANRRRELLDAIDRISGDDPIAWKVASPKSAYDHPVFARSFSSRWLDLMSGLAALEILEHARPLATETHHAPQDEEFALDRQEIRALRQYTDTLSGRLVDLVNSKRADWGQTLLIGMARLSALSRTVESRHLVFLDTFPAEARMITPREIDRSSEVQSMMLVENRKRLDSSRAYFKQGTDSTELAWERVEERSNRYFEIRRALRDGVGIRVARGHLIPAHAADFASPFVPKARGLQSAANLARARERERAYERILRRLHRYELITQNCATALFETINDSFEGSIELSHRELGGYVRSQRSLAFIPFMSARQVNARYSVVARETIPSYRQLRLEAMKKQESAFRVAIRESNTLTAKSYERGSADSFFIFFTDGHPLLRPVFGLFNLTAAIGQSLLGIVTAPVDQGSNLTLGLRGAFVSLVELGFANIRKGSNDWIPAEHRRLGSIEEPTLRAADISTTRLTTSR